ncbi:MAG: odulation protein NolG [Armatimonadetes bacterium CSP1-3]|nr:MAG: odulation protein NolG [Armatimonadetes bacterium CSP1-3]
MSLSGLAVRRPVLVLVMIATLLVLGGISYGRLPVELMPNVQFPFVTVTVAYPGAGPEEVETLITKPLEEQLSSLEGVRTLRSVSQEGLAIVAIEFALGTDIDTAVADVRQRADLVQNLFPRDAEDPVVQKFNFSALPVMLLGVSGPDPLALRNLAADVIKPTLERVPGVAAVTVSGGRTREIRIEISQDRLRAEGLTAFGVEDALRQANLNVPSGRIREGDEEFLVRVVGQFATADEIGSLPLRRVDGTTVPLRAVADVRDTTREPDQFTRLNGEDSVGVSVQKQSGANTVAVAEGVRQAITTLQRQLPAGVKIAIARDDSLFIKDSVADVQGNLILGSILATIVVFLFLHNLRSTIIIGLALPAAVVATYVPMYFFGFSLNVLSLLALAIAIGLLIDNAIVVNENISRHLERGEPPLEAARRGSREVEVAVLASNLANVAVFLPIAFTRGLVGQFFRQFGLTVVFANLFSILIGFTLTPMLSARWLRYREPGRGRLDRIWTALDRSFDRLSLRYSGWLTWALGHRVLVLVVAGVLFIASLGLVASPLIGKEFFPGGDFGQFQVTLTMPPGSSLNQTNRATERVETVLDDLPEVENYFSLVGGVEGMFTFSSVGSQQAQLFVNLVDRGKRQRSVDEVMEDVRARTREIPGATIKVGAQGVTGGEAPVQVEIRGPDSRILERLARQVEEIVTNTSGTTNVDTNVNAGKREIQILLDKERLARLGLSVAQVGTQVRTAVAGTQTTRYRAGGDEVDIVVRSQEEDRDAIGKLANLHIGMVNGAPIRLGDVATLVQRRAPATIERKDRQRLALVSASLRGRPLSAVIGDIQAGLRDVALPPGYTATFGGEAQFQTETFGDMLFALALGSLFVFMTIAVQFDSLAIPVIIMASVPLASIGTFLMLLLTRTTVSLMSLLGIIMLAGIVVNNAILLIEFVVQRRKEGIPRNQAILDAARTRLRPILMTALVSIMGGLPVAIGLGSSGAEWRRPLGIAVLGGMTTSTFLTLLVIPVVYTLMDDLLSRRRAPAAQPVELTRPAPVTGAGQDLAEDEDRP